MEHPTVIVGGGLAGLAAGLAFAGRTPVLLADAPSVEAASTTAIAGLANPVIPRRANIVWRGAQALDALDSLGQNVGAGPLHHGMLRPATSWEEMDGYRARAAAHPRLATWHSPDAARERWPWLLAPHGSLEVHRGGAYDIPAFVAAARRTLGAQGASLQTGWQLVDWQESGDAVHAHFDAPDGRHVVACGLLILAMGAGFLRFPALRALNLHALKGQLITLSAPSIPSGVRPVSSQGYMVPIDGRVVIGSSYEHTFSHPRPEASVSMELQERAAAFLPFLSGAKVLEARAGIRVTVPGTRLPMVGPLPDHRRTWLLTGLASRGLLMSAFLASRLVDWVRDPGQIPREVQVRRPR